jgi:hypothetical protein
MTSWPRPPRGPHEDRDALERAVEALRVLQATITAAAPDDVAVWEDVAARLSDVTALLADQAVGEDRQVIGRRADLVGRGQAMTPPIHVEESDDQHVRGRVTFSRFYLGGNGAVHGGTQPLVFDDVLGRQANSGRTRARTAYLHVDYRAIAPVDVELDIVAWVEREEGRKRFVRGSLQHAGSLLAEAEGLFVELRHGQP